jgi:hypothetical protein
MWNRRPRLFISEPRRRHRPERTRTDVNNTQSPRGGTGAGERGVREEVLLAVLGFPATGRQAVTGPVGGDAFTALAAPGAVVRGARAVVKVALQIRAFGLRHVLPHIELVRKVSACRCARHVSFGERRRMTCGEVGRASRAEQAQRDRAIGRRPARLRAAPPGCPERPQPGRPPYPVLLRRRRAAALDYRPFVQGTGKGAPNHPCGRSTAALAVGRRRVSQRALSMRARKKGGIHALQA